MADADIADIIFRPISFNYFEMLELYKPGEAQKKILEALESASSNLQDVSTALRFAEFFADEEIAAVHFIRLSGRTMIQVGSFLMLL